MKTWLPALMKVLNVAVAAGVLYGLIQMGRILERLDDVESVYAQTIRMQGTVSLDDFQELRDIHVRNGDIP